MRVAVGLMLALFACRASTIPGPPTHPSASGGTGNNEPSVGPTGANGQKGDTGNVGPQGLAGLNGTDGAQGLNGDKGADGLPGVQGVQGFQGPAGVPGERGAAGAQGTQGPKGDTGAKGETGPKGLTGDKGNAGVQGPTGSPGTVGPKGDVGAKGATGTQGVVGVTGAKGTDGVSCSSTNSVLLFASRVCSPTTLYNATYHLSEPVTVLLPVEVKVNIGTATDSVFLTLDSIRCEYANNSSDSDENSTVRYLFKECKSTSDSGSVLTNVVPGKPFTVSGTWGLTISTTASCKHLQVQATIQAN